MKERVLAFAWVDPGAFLLLFAFFFSELAAAGLWWRGLVREVVLGLLLRGVHCEKLLRFLQAFFAFLICQRGQILASGAKKLTSFVCV